MKGASVRSIFWSLIKAWAAIVALALALPLAPAAARYSDIYDKPEPKLTAAQAAFDALAPDASEAERAARVSDLIIRKIGAADYKGGYELWLAHQALPLHRDAVAGAMGHGLVAFAADDAMRADYIARLTAIAAGESCRPCYARTFAAHHLARYYFTGEDDIEKSVKAHERALALAREDFAADDPVLVNFLFQLAQYTRRIDLDRAQELARETERAAFDLLPSDDHVGWLYVFIVNANIAQDKGRLSQAADLWAKVADIGVTVWGEDDPNLLPIYQNSAMLASKAGRTAQAVETALLASANEGYSDAKELADHRALIAALLLGDARLDEAVAAYRSALDLLETVASDDLVQAKVRIELAQALSIKGAHEEALALMRAGLPLYQAKLEATNPARRGRETQAATILSRAGLNEQASALMQPVLDYNESILLDVYARDQDRAALASDANAMFRDSVAIALLSGDEERAWRSAQLSAISDLALSAAALSYPGDPDGFADALEALRTARKAEDAARSAFAGGEGGGAGVAEAIARRQRAQEDLEQRFPDYAEYLRPAPLTLAQTQAALAEGEVYVLPIVYPDRFVTLAISADGFAWDVSAVPLHSSRALIQRLRQSLDEGSLGEGLAGAATAFDAEAAYALYQRIFTPKIRAATKGAAKLVFPAGGALAVIPPSVLLTQPPEEAAPLAFLIRDHAIAITAGLSQRKRAGGRAIKGFAGIGAPLLADPPANRAALRGAVVDVDSIAALPSLPGALAELTALEAAFAGRETLILSGKAATEPAVRAAPLGEYQVLAFATHGLVSGQVAGLAEPALVLTPQSASSARDDALLTASEIAGLRLAADWIILSACNTAAGEGPGDPIYSGLARAFQLAGARSLLLSHWPVRDDVATRISVATVKAAASGVERSEALRRAQLALIDEANGQNAMSPALWAPFVLIE